MKRVAAYITGNVQRAGYRGKVIDIAIAFGLNGIVQNLEDGRVKVTAEGDEADLERFIKAIDIKNTLIHVSSIESDYSPATGEYEGFHKLVGRGETDSRLDAAVVQLKDLKDAINNMNSNLGGKMDQMIQKQDRTLSGQDELLVEVKDMNRSLNEKADQLIKKQDDLVKNEIAEIKTALKAKGIM